MGPVRDDDLSHAAICRSVGVPAGGLVFGDLGKSLSNLVESETLGIAKGDLAKVELEAYRNPKPSREAFRRLGGSPQRTGVDCNRPIALRDKGANTLDLGPAPVGQNRVAP